jgi:acyl-CoA thioesterase-1
MKLYFLSVFIILQTFFLIEPKADPGPRYIVCLGDSLTLGSLNSRGADYPNLLRRSIDAEVYNLGVARESSFAGLNRIDRVMSQYNPTHILILFGTNDVNGWGGLDPSVENIIEMARRAHARGTLPIIGTIPPFVGPKIARYQRSLEFNEKLRIAASVKGYAVADIGDVFDGRSDLMLSDGFHPTDAGLRVIMDVFLGKINTTPAYHWLAVGARSYESNWYEHPGFGFFNTTFSPWIFHPQMGWLYMFGNDREQIWLYDDSAGIMYTSNQHFNYFWSTTHETWLEFLGAGNGRIARFYDHNRQRYVWR